ncbi:hypothetical protein GCM10023149_12950 [Mucilaginibacter gynuensis]|uniref:Phosphoribosylpyrophosphate synthetase n=1 Tax=Mucilaginibacter gynuensis TaxID=1302236 RepID=A0ABP8G2T7_9SPHI
MKNYDTVSEAVNDLVERGYTANFNVDAQNDFLNCPEQQVSLSPEDFEIDETHRFEGETDPGDEMVVYAVSSPNYGIKGVVVNAFGTYSDSGASKLVQRLKEHLD